LIFDQHKNKHFVKDQPNVLVEFEDTKGTIRIRI